MSSQPKVISAQQARDLWLAGFTFNELLDFDIDAFQLMALKSLFYALDKVLEDKVKQTNILNK